MQTLWLFGWKSRRKRCKRGLGERAAESERRLLVDEMSKYCEEISYTGRSIKIGRMHCVEKETKREQRLSM